MTAKEMQDRKRELGVTYQWISNLCDVPVPTVQKIIMGETENPRAYTKQLIENVLQNAPMVYEKASEYTYRGKKQGEYVVDPDYYLFPEDERCEIIDGVVYDMGAPTLNHQDIAGEMYYQFRNYIDSNKGQCRVYISPIDVKLDDKTTVQPDVAILCDKSKNKIKRVEGAPDFIAEVTSESNRSYDYIIKQKKYFESGVREYWIVDPKKKTVVKYVFKGELFEREDYTFADPVPVHIYDGNCIIDFSGVEI